MRNGSRNQADTKVVQGKEGKRENRSGQIRATDSAKGKQGE